MALLCSDWAAGFLDGLEKQLNVSVFDFVNIY